MLNAHWGNINGDFQEQGRCECPTTPIQSSESPAPVWLPLFGSRVESAWFRQIWLPSCQLLFSKVLKHTSLRNPSCPSITIQESCIVPYGRSSKVLKKNGNYYLKTTEIYCLWVLEERITNLKKSKITGVTLGILGLVDASLRSHGHPLPSSSSLSGCPNFPFFKDTSHIGLEHIWMTSF